MSHTRGLVEVADVDSQQLALRIDVWHEALDTLPVQVQEPVFGAWPEPSFHPPPSSPPPSQSRLYPDLIQQALLENNERIYHLPGFCTTVSCGLEIDTPVPSENHIDKDPSRQHLNTTRKKRDTSSREEEDGDAHIYVPLWHNTIESRTHTVGQ